jgi:uncharacterized protein (UPF0332 family)
MSLHGDLLEQAEHLVRRERRRPRQASPRRAISSAYYALFHLLIHQATLRVIRNPALRHKFSRAFEHADMKSASRAFASAQPARLAALTGGLPIPPQLQTLAATFVELQQARHEADYNVAARFTRVEAEDLIGLARQAFHDWPTLRTDDASQMYLSALLLWKRWDR